MKSKECSHKGCPNPVWAGGKCMSHIDRKPMKKSAMKRGGSISIVDKMRPYATKMHKKADMYRFFLTIWVKRGNKSEVSGETIYGTPSSAHFHHILPKYKYPLAEMDEENIIIMTMDEHNNVENDMYKYAEVNQRRETLLRKYDLI